MACTYTQVVPSGGDAQELLAKIQRTHLNYLQLDNNSHKLKARYDLEDLISTHLSTVPHKEKFTCPRFLEILRRSIEDKVEFNASSAAKAFDILESYAENLISQPWRKEFRCFKLYNGFFKHNVESQLSCSEEVFAMMGYEDGEFMEMNMEGPVDPDRVIDVSLNCLIAVVECKMMGEIMDKLSESSWQDIASVRRHNVCGVVKTVQIITKSVMKKSRMYGYTEDKVVSPKVLADGRPGWVNPTKNNSSRYVKVEKLVDAPSWTDGGDLMMDPDRRYPHTYYGSTWEEKSNGHHHHHNNYQQQPQFDTDFFIPKTIDEHINLQNICLNDRLTRQLKYTPGAPEVGPRNDSWGYIERMQHQPQQQQQHQLPADSWRKFYLDSQASQFNQHYPLSRSLIKQQPAPVVDDIYRSVLCKQTFPPKIYNSSSLHDPTIDQSIYAASPSYLYLSRPTDHLYRANLQQQHYAPPVTSSYDQGLPKINNTPSNTLAHTGQDEVTMRVKMQAARDEVPQRRSWYDNVDSAEPCEQPQVNTTRRLVNNGDVLPPPTQFQNEPEVVKAVSTGSSRSHHHRRWPSDGSPMVKSDRDTNKFISSASFDGKVTSGWSSSSKDEGSKDVAVLKSGVTVLPKVEMRPPGTWSCLACTFLNPPDSRICEMCSRSRRPGAESDPLSSGGHECQKCTLVNDKGAPKCLACGHSLENSPTYV